MARGSLATVAALAFAALLLAPAAYAGSVGNPYSREGLDEMKAKEEKQKREPPKIVPDHIRKGSKEYHKYIREAHAQVKDLGIDPEHLGFNMTEVEEAHAQPLDLFEVGKDMDHETLKEQFQKHPEHHDINKPVHYSGLTALKQGILNGNHTYVKTAIELGANVTQKLEGWRPIHFAAAAAARLGTPKVVHILAEAGADVSEVTTAGYTAVHTAARQFRHEAANTVRALVEHGVDVNAQRTKGNRTTALMEASLRAGGHMVKALIDLGANLDIQDADNNTALHHSIRGDNPTATYELLEAGANDRLLDAKGNNPVILAQKMKVSWETIDLFRRMHEKWEKKREHAAKNKDHTELR